MKTGIFGGTFDPVHNEHINICLFAKKQFALDRIIVLPAGNPPHKKAEFLLAEKKHRYNMAMLAFEGIEGIILSDYEITKSRPAYTYETLMFFKDIYPEEEFYLILGADSVISLDKWRNPQEIFSICSVIACGREGYEGYNEKVNKLKEKYGARILNCDYKGSNISSSALKVFIEFNTDYDGYLSPKVTQYIKDNKLYTKYSEYIEKLKTMLSEKRFNHTVYTVIEALKLARRTGCDEEKTFIAAALHDCTKKLSDERLQSYGFILNSQVPEPVAHSVSGSFIARTVFGIKDKDILNSIRYHTTGRPKMSLLEKVIYVADCIEQTRDYEGVEYLRNEVKKDFEKGFLACMEVTIQQLKTMDREEVSDMTLKAYEYYTENKF